MKTNHSGFDAKAVNMSQAGELLVITAMRDATKPNP
jgi:hypothetical protein